MCVALIGGMDRLKKHYVEEAKKVGVQLRVFTKLEKDTAKKIGDVDAIVIFTNKISHELKLTIKKVYTTKKCPYMMCHSCGVSSLIKCLENIKKIKQKGEM